MPKTPSALSADAVLDVAPASLREAVVIDLDDVAQRRERLAAYSDATRPVIVYRFVFPDGARVAALGGAGQPRDAVDQLYAIVGLAGGGLGRSQGGLAARIPKILAAKFESLARPLIEAYLVSLDLGEDD